MMRTLLPPNAAPLEVAVDGAVARQIETIPENLIFDQWHPDRCPVALLGWLAWAVSVDDWNPNWPNATKRAVITSAVAVHRQKGTLAAIKRILDSFDLQTVLKEQPPHAFSITVFASQNRDLGAVFDASDIAELRQQIIHNKPARSQFSLNIGTSMLASLGIAAGIAVQSFRRVGLSLAMPSSNARTGLGLACGVRLIILQRFSMET